jgi:non-canonical (house-cleaning) NTP pyrophosphatase
MEEVTMDISWHTVQLFLDPDGVCEVEVASENKNKVRCTCQAFARIARCKHVNYVKHKMATNDGHYSIQIPVNVDETIAVKEMNKGPEAFREFVIKYGKVEVID